ncbi:MAG TPA: hypothetical protein VM658_10270 [bacterium]|nr:hypothetical protein [bacterium]
MIKDGRRNVKDEADLLAAFHTAAAHLEAGGVFITSPDHFAESFHPPRIEQSTPAAEWR